MIRLKLPSEFIKLVMNMLSGLTTSVRTAYGNSQVFQVSKGLRQWDPLSPLLFIIFMDPLHWGLENNPYGKGKKKHLGCKISDSLYICSKGFADDTWIISDDPINLQLQHKWVLEWCTFNHLQLHPEKFQLVGITGTGQCITSTTTNISINQHQLLPLPLDSGIKYVGCKLQMNLQWKAQISATRFLLHQHCQIAINSNISISQHV